MTAAVQKAKPATGWANRGLEPAKVLQVFGMRRSGNHAVINWLLRNPIQGSTGTVFLNNCTPWRDPFDSRKSLEVNGKRRGEKTDTIRKAGSSPMVIVSYEDCAPPDLGAKKAIMQGFAARDVDHTIIVYRSFLNWSASLLKKLRGNAGYRSVTRGRIMLRSIEQYGRILARLKQPGIVGICYDSWVNSPRYRDDVLGQLGLPTNDNALGDIQRYGGGSSFQQEALSGQDLGAHQRWIEMIEDAEYLVSLWVAAQDADLLEAVSQFFPDDVALLQPLIGSHPGLGGQP